MNLTVVKGHRVSTQNVLQTRPIHREKNQLYRIQIRIVFETWIHIRFRAIHTWIRIRGILTISISPGGKGQ